jgi:hypothetical protein
VAIQPAPALAGPHPNLLDLTGVTHILESVTGCAVGGVQHIQFKLGGRFPGLEGTPPLLAITDPANLSEGASPAVQVAAKVKAEEDAAQQKIKGIQYLATIGCGGCYPDVEEALLSALDDCTEAVRYEAVKAIRATIGNECVFCKADACCSPAVKKKLRSIAYDIDKSGCFEEPSERVRRLARLALCSCCGDEPAEELPEEGPEETPPSPSKAGDGAVATAALPVGPATEVAPATENARLNQSASVAKQSAFELVGADSKPSLAIGLTAEASDQPATEQANSAAATSETPARVVWEEITINPADFESVERARQIMLYLKARGDGKDVEKPEFNAEEIAIRQYDSATSNEAQWKEKRDYLKSLPVGKTSPILTHRHRWHLIRVLSRTN